MPKDLLRAVTTTLQPLGFEIVDSRTFDSFDNAFVVLHSPTLRIRVVRERGQILVDFGPSGEPNTWFDSDIVLEQLGLSTDRSFGGMDITEVLDGVAAFVRVCGGELTRMFDDRHLVGTKHDIGELKERRAQRLFGWKPPAGK